MNRILSTLAVAVVFVASGAVVPTAGRATASTPHCCTPWRVAPAPDPSGRAELTDVASFSTGGAWAVGFTVADICCSATIALHEHAGTWTQVPTPNPAPLSNQLFAVAGSADDDVWAVGSGSDNGGDTARTLIEHWDGVSWRVVPSPSPRNRSDTLFGVSVRSRTDAWAVGDVENVATNTGVTLIEHWDGRRWSIVPSPNADKANTLEAVSASSPNDAWATGVSSRSSGLNGHNLALHWDGSEWERIDVPNPGVVDDALESILAVSRDDAWAVGYATDAAASTRTPITLRWDGSQWSLVANPPLFGQLTAVAAARGRAVWAAGYREDPTTTLIERWDGSAWRIVPSANPPRSPSNLLLGIAVGARTNSYWAVGADYFPSTRDHTLIEHPVGWATS